MVEGSKAVVMGSVEGTIADKVRDIVKPKDGIMHLHAAGIEDLDVRMLGTGRPFIFEVINPTRVLSCRTKVSELFLNGPHVFCQNFSIVTNSFFDDLKDME